MNSKLKSLQEQRQKLDEKIKLLEKKEKSEQLKRQNRKRYILGDLLTSWIENNDAMGEKAREDLKSILTKKSDRLLFNLDP